MLTRLKVSGFKNLWNVDVRFGPFTCIAGANGVGKSNLFDAIQFLSALADNTLLEAAQTIRSGGEKGSDVRSLFCKRGDTNETEMSFEAEMIVPKKATDDLGQTAEASITFLKYSLTIVYAGDAEQSSVGPLQIREETLAPIPLGEAKSRLLFPHSASQWRKTALDGRRSTHNPFISTSQDEGKYVVKLHQDGGGRGRPLLQVSNLPRTVVSGTNAGESPTALSARREMQSWRLLQLEPSALRKPDEFSALTQFTSLASNGGRLPVTLYRLAHQNPLGEDTSDPDRVYAQVAGRLAELIDDVREVGIDRDEKRELYTLYAGGKDGVRHPAKALSDGTLRFLALSVLAEDTGSSEVLCLEEPENGIHPRRIPAMLELLQDLVTDVQDPLGPDNPLRQVIVNTHSPSVVQQIPDDCLLVATLKETDPDCIGFRSVCFSYLPDTWRAKTGDRNVCSKGDLLAYLNPVPRLDEPKQDISQQDAGMTRKGKSRRVMDRKDLQMMLFGFGEDAG